MLAPITDPPSIRDFYAFEQHVGSGYRKRGKDIPQAWFEVPVFYFAHIGNIFGPGDPISKPAACEELDFELELAAIIGKSGRDISAEHAWEHIAVMNDWSARDIQRQEMSVGLARPKAKTSPPHLARSWSPSMSSKIEYRETRSIFACLPE